MCTERNRGEMSSGRQARQELLTASRSVPGLKQLRSALLASQIRCANKHSILKLQGEKMHPSLLFLRQRVSGREAPPEGDS